MPAAELCGNAGAAPSVLLPVEVKTSDHCN